MEALLQSNTQGCNQDRRASDEAHVKPAVSNIIYEFFFKNPPEPSDNEMEDPTCDSPAKTDKPSPIQTDDPNAQQELQNSTLVTQGDKEAGGKVEDVEMKATTEADQQQQDSQTIAQHDVVVKEAHVEEHQKLVDGNEEQTHAAKVDTEMKDEQASKEPMFPHLKVTGSVKENYLVDLNGNCLGFISGSSVKYCKTKAFETESAEDIKQTWWTNKEEGRFITAPFYYINSRFRELDVVNLTPMRKALYLSYYQTRVQDIKAQQQDESKLASQINTFLNCLHVAMRLPKDFSKYKLPQFLKCSFQDLSVLEETYGGNLQLFDVSHFLKKKQTNSLNSLMHDLLNEQPNAFVSGGRIEVSDSFCPSYIQAIVECMIKHAFSLEKNFKQYPERVLDIQYATDVKAFEDRVGMLVELYEQTFPNGVKDLEELMRGMLACLRSIEDQETGFQESWDQVQSQTESCLCSQQLIELQILALVQGIPFLNQVGREAWYFYWGSLVHSLNVALGLESDRKQRMFHDSTDIIPIVTGASQDLLSYARSKFKANHLDGSDREIQKMGYRFLTNTNSLDVFKSDLDTFEKVQIRFWDNFTRLHFEKPQKDQASNSYMALKLDGTKHKISAADTQALLEYYVINLKTTQVTHFKLDPEQGKRYTQNQCLRKLVNELQACCPKLFEDESDLNRVDAYYNCIKVQKDSSLDLADLLLQITADLVKKWNEMYNTETLFVPRNTQLVIQLLMQKQAFKQELDSIQRVGKPEQSGEFFTQISTALEQCPIYLDMQLRRILLRVFALAKFEVDQLKSIFTTSLSLKPLDLQQNFFTQNTQGLENLRNKLAQQKISTSATPTKSSFKTLSISEASKLWIGYKKELQAALNSRNSVMQKQFPQSQVHATVNTLFDCLNPDQGPQNRNQWVIFCQQYDLTKFSLQITQVPRLIWFAMEIDNKNLSVALQNYCINFCKEILSNEHFQELSWTRWPPANQ